MAGSSNRAAAPQVPMVGRDAPEERTPAVAAPSSSRLFRIKPGWSEPIPHWLEEVVPFVQVAWAKLGTHTGKLYVERWRRVDEGQNDYYYHPLYALDPNAGTVSATEEKKSG